MYGDRDCENCIFHDEACTKWECKYISRDEAEKAVEYVRENNIDPDEVDE